MVRRTFGREVHWRGGMADTEEGTNGGKVQYNKRQGKYTRGYIRKGGTHGGR